MLQAFRARWVALAAIPTLGALFALLWVQRGTAGSLLPHGYCFTWNPTLVWTHVLSDGLIGLAYVSIPVTLVNLVRRRGDMPFDWVVVLFALFIVSCGATHLLGVWTVWYPDYWLLANVKVVTALASTLTAAALVALAPRILAIPSTRQLQAAKDALEVEVAQRREVEALLRQERAELEHRVAERTRQLSQASAEARAAHEAAEEANALKDRFLAKVSHELRTPLQSTLTWSHLLMQAGANAEHARRAAERILHNVHTQARLIDDLLDISRILSGKLSLQMSQVDAAQVIRKAADVASANAAARRITVELPPAGPALPLTTDPVRLEQVVWNLINNAVQASPEGGRVKVDFSADEQGLKVRVTDWGRGIAPAELPLLFEPFQQSRHTRNAHRGLGLGLAIARSIVDLFGGRLQAHSEGMGHGASFEFTLPRAASGRDAAPPAAEGLSEEDLDRLRGLRVLYVEDEPDLAEGVRLALCSVGLQVQWRPDANTALEPLDSAGFDLLLCDLDLGQGQRGEEVLARLRAQPGGRWVPAVALSAYGGVEDRQASQLAGFTAHIVKPADLPTIARALLEAMETARRPA